MRTILPFKQLKKGYDHLVSLYMYIPAMLSDDTSPCV